MIERIRNSITITCDDANFSTATGIEVYLRQGELFFQYTPIVASEHVLVVVIPKADAMQLTPGNCHMQFAFTDANDNPQASNVQRLSVTELLKEAGYGV